MWCKITFVLLFVLFAVLNAQYPIPSGDPTNSGWPNKNVLLPWSQTCMGARNTYWAQNTDVKNANLDPVWHYQNSGWSDGRAWPTTACNTNPIYANNSLCNCTTAQSIFMSKYVVPGLTNNASAFAYWTLWAPYYTSGGKVWHCDICMEELGLESSSSEALPEDCQCWEAREKYWNTYKDVYFANLDPVSHYLSSGHRENRTWDCALCNATTAIQPYDSVCGCAAAANRFNNDFPTVGTNVNTAYPKWVTFNKAGDSEAWHCELCVDELNEILNGTLDGAPTSTSGGTGSAAPYRLPTECTCVQAGTLYLNATPIAEQANDDPVWYYEHSGYTIKKNWDCSPCQLASAVPYNSSICNCSQAIAEYQKRYSAGFSNLTPAQLFEYWLDIGRPQIGQFWDCQQCINIILAEEAAAAAAASEEAAKEAAAHRIHPYDPVLNGAFGGILAGALSLFTLFAAVMLAMYWTAFAKHGSFYCAVIITGVALSAVSILTQIPRPTDALCTAFPWFLGTAFILVYGCLFIKTWALYKVWKAASNFKRSNLTPLTILKILGVALAIEFAYLAVWTGIDMPKVVLSKTVSGDYQHLCQSKTVAWWAVFLGVKGGWMVFGAILSILTRNIAKDYSDSKMIGFIIYADTIVLMFAIPLAVALENNPGIVFIVEVIAICIIFGSTLILFAEIWWGIFVPEKDMISAIKMTPSTRSRSSNSPNHSGTSTTRNSTVNVTATVSGHSNSSHSSA